MIKNTAQSNMAGYQKVLRFHSQTDSPWAVLGVHQKINGRHDQRREDAVGEMQERYDHLAASIQA
jgi:hypothetical protein